ncbi:septum site-determining protein MinC [Gorillibacterium sp. sgz500922]|uniref:septum site-determining protein MinC n=1 Tax=Gorillibacterium sp. sgz500922 TaxID=3446694 RepID=UPI003F667E02
MNKPMKGKPQKDPPAASAAAGKRAVTIKGVKDGLVFHFDDACRYTELVEDLRHKLGKTHDQILSGPPIQVRIKLGRRRLNEAERAEILEIIAGRENLIVQAIETDPEAPAPSDPMKELKIIKGVVRSGQTVEHDGHLMLLGDVNPGGAVLAAGDIYILGALRGMAHAGYQGDRSAIIAASLLGPTQLRIAGIISRPPDEWGFDREKESTMEFACIREDVMVIDKINQLQRLRPDAQNMLLNGE